MRYPNLIIFLVIVVLSVGCASVGIDYHTPAAPDTASFLKTNSVQFAENADMTEWWKKLNDPALDRLVEHGLKNNKDLKIAFSRIMEARAYRGIAKSEQLPSVNLGGEVKALRLSENGLEAANVPSGGSFGNEHTLYEAGFDASWELDLFGRIKRNIEAADAEIEISNADFADTLVTLIADIAKNYIDLRKVQAQTALLKQEIDTEQKALKLHSRLFDNGMESRINVEKSKASLSEIQAKMPNLISEEQILRYRLAILLGEPPRYLDDLIHFSPVVPMFSDTIAVGFPTDMLRNRPDIKSAERNLAAETARIGIAAADLYPSIRLLGSIGFSTVSLSDAGLSSSMTGSIGPSFSWNVFNGGAVRARIAAADARSKASLAMYEKTVIKAYEEVESSISMLDAEMHRKTKLEQVLNANNSEYKLSLQLYDQGLSDLVTVLDSQSKYLKTKQNIADSDAAAAKSVISLYKSFGGGVITATAK